MRNNGFPIIDVETVEEALDFVESIHSAWEKAGGDEKVTIGALLVAGAFLGVDEAALAVLGEAAAIVLVAYLAACVGCMGSVAIDDLRRLFAQGDLPDFVVAQLEEEGLELAMA
jgi:hypothetical protein